MQYIKYGLEKKTVFEKEESVIQKCFFFLHVHNTENIYLIRIEMNTML